MSRNKSAFHEQSKLLMSEHLTEQNFARTFMLFTNLALNRFVWKNLPKGMESRFIEKALFDYGQCAFVDDSEIGIICLPSTNSSNLNVYGEPTSLTLYGYGASYTKIYDIDEVVRIINNDSALPTKHHVLYYANKIYEIDKAIDKNLRQQKRPYIIATSKENELTMRNIIKDVREDKDEIFVDDKLTAGGRVGSDVLNINVPYLLDKYQQQKKDLMDEFLTIMGLNNTSSNNNKKERLLVDEVNVNNGEILMHLDIDFKNRQKACEEINKKFNLNISVEKNIYSLSDDFLENKGEGDNE